MQGGILLYHYHKIRQRGLWRSKVRRQKNNSRVYFNGKLLTEVMPEKFFPFGFFIRKHLFRDAVCAIYNLEDFIFHKSD